MKYTLEPNSVHATTVYLYWNTKYNWLTVTETNHWEGDSKVTNNGEFYLLDKQPTSFNIGNVDINDIKLHGLERQLELDLADSYVRQERLRDEIQKLKCLTHEKADGQSEVIEMFVEPEYTSSPQPDYKEFNDDIPF